MCTISFSEYCYYIIPRPPGDGGFLFQIPRGTPGRGILKLRIPRGPAPGMVSLILMHTFVGFILTQYVDIFHEIV